MIFDSLDNFNNYLCLHHDFIDASGFIGRHDLAELPQGKYEVGSPGLFAIFFHHDGHMPQVQYADEPETVKKVVLKVPV